VLIDKGKIEVLEEEAWPVPLCPPHIHIDFSQSPVPPVSQHLMK
jgi:hypothetical protein